MVDVEREGSVARIFLNRPEKANALNSPALEDLRRAFRELAADPSLGAAILGGRGRTFCGGADRPELESLTASTAGAFVESIHRVCREGLIEEIGDGEKLVQALLAADREALRVQKQLVQLWDEAPLATSVAASIERCAQIHTTIASGLRARKD